MKENGEYHELREEILEHIWTHRELEETPAPRSLLDPLGEEDLVGRTVERLVEEGALLEVSEGLLLTPSGADRARQVVRAHRLAARLLTDLLDFRVEAAEHQACRLEHALGPEITDSLCTLLGHPPTSPSGRPIPDGDCCRASRTETCSVVRPLRELGPGGRGRITFVHPRVANRLSQLTLLGLSPGAEVQLRQLHPSVVVHVGETTLALDRAVADDVFVRPVE